MYVKRIKSSQYVYQEPEVKNAATAAQHCQYATPAVHEF